MRTDRHTSGPMVLVIEDPSRLRPEVWRELEAAGLRSFAAAENPASAPTAVDGLRAALDAGDLEEAEQILRASGPQLAADEPELFDGLLGGVNILELDSRPALRWSLVISAVLLGRRDRLPALLRHILSDHDRRRGAVERALTRGLRCAVQRRLARPGAVTTAVALDSMLHDLTPEDRRVLGPWLPAMHYECGMALLGGGRVVHAHSVFERGTEVMPDPWWQRVLLSCVAMTDLVLGRVNDARLRREECPEVGRPHPCDDLILALDAALALEDDDVERARAFVGSIGAATEHRGVVELVRGLVDLTDGNPRVARERFVSGAEALTEGIGWADVLGSLTMLSELASKGPVAVRAEGTASSVIRAHAALASGDLDLVRELVGELRDDGRNVTPRRRLHAAVLEFAFVRRLGQGEVADRVAERIVALVETHGITWPLRLLSPGDAEALATSTGLRSLRSLLPADTSSLRLTERERILLRELVRGGTEAAIAARQHLSVNTIKSQRRSLYRKLGVRDRDQAVARALELDLLGAPRPAAGGPVLRRQVKGGVKRP
ncbi:DNA-binding response regulator [Aeromicrobium phragmitis]|uniref:DNA-binding response regulator n=1 Tax=Aeromicrobium phragmitis TaxID=2478914 RepID=A0A3L8PQA2_9ACTN|nr:LuxR C-terminal-related transcriptional regulator [Aeromicrobium phragmitis]RLV57541.1 DNA-binding response regulator [Aeromicrobium phragmitis]